MHDIPVAVCISTWNRAEDLKKCINSIQSQHYDHTIISIYVIDNHSDDHTKEVLESFPDIHFQIMPHSNFTAIQTINKCLRKAYNTNYKYILILDDDAEMINPMTISSLVLNMERDPEIAICGARINDANFDASKIVTFGTRLHPNRDEILKSSPYALKTSPNFHGACAMFRASVVGPEFYDESYEIYWNEPDLSVKLSSCGYKICTDETVIVNHGSKVNRNSSRSLYYQHRNTLKFISKYLDRKAKLICIPLLLTVWWYGILKDKTLTLSHTFKLLYHTMYNLIILWKSPVTQVPTDVHNRYYYHFIESIIDCFKRC